MWRCTWLRFGDIHCAPLRRQLALLSTPGPLPTGSASPIVVFDDDARLTTTSQNQPVGPSSDPQRRPCVQVASRPF